MHFVSHSFGNIIIMTKSNTALLVYPVVILLIKSMGHLETTVAALNSSPLSPKVWLSEYGYTRETEDVITFVTIPTEKDFMMDKFENKFISKSGTDFKITGNISHAIFTCEADHPVLWSATQNLKYSNPPMVIHTFDFQRSNFDGISSNESNFRSLIQINFYQNQLLLSSDVADLFQSHLSNSLFWILTCHSAGQLGSQENTSVTLSMSNNDNLGQKEMGTLKPDENMVLAITRKIDNNEQQSKLNQSESELVTLHLDNALFHTSNENANKERIILESNFTMDFDYLKSDNISKVTLMEYKEGENVYNGDKIQVLCFSLRRFYAFGAYVQITWENGTKTLIPEENSTTYDLVHGETEVHLSAERLAGTFVDINLTDWTYLEEELIFYLTKTFEAELGMQMVDCYMPVWSTGEWNKMSKSMTVLTQKP